MGKLKRFLLVDDSAATNFFNKTIIHKTDCVNEIVVAINGKEALHYIQSEVTPDIIFLDLNMPVMNGWEFIEEYKNLPVNYRSSIIVVMLGAKLDPEEKQKLLDVKEVKEFRNKMLSKEVIHELIKRYFHKEISSTQQSM